MEANCRIAYGCNEGVEMSMHRQGFHAFLAIHEESEASLDQMLDLTEMS